MNRSKLKWRPKPPQATLSVSQEEHDAHWASEAVKAWREKNPVMPFYKHLEMAELAVSIGISALQNLSKPTRQEMFYDLVKAAHSLPPEGPQELRVHPDDWHELLKFAEPVYPSDAPFDRFHGLPVVLDYTAPRLPRK